MAYPGIHVPIIDPKGVVKQVRQRLEWEKEHARRIEYKEHVLAQLRKKLALRTAEKGMDAKAKLMRREVLIAQREAKELRDAFQSKVHQLEKRHMKWLESRSEPKQLPLKPKLEWDAAAMERAQFEKMTEKMTGVLPAAENEAAAQDTKGGAPEAAPLVESKKSSSAAVERVVLGEPEIARFTASPALALRCEKRARRIFEQGQPVTLYENPLGTLRDNAFLIWIPLFAMSTFFMGFEVMAPVSSSVVDPLHVVFFSISGALLFRALWIQRNKIRKIVLEPHDRTRGLITNNMLANFNLRIQASGVGWIVRGGTVVVPCNQVTLNGLTNTAVVRTREQWTKDLLSGEHAHWVVKGLIAKVMRPITLVVLEFWYALLPYTRYRLKIGQKAAWNLDIRGDAPLGRESEYFPWVAAMLHLLTKNA
jgi:hypothetical protein